MSIVQRKSTASVMRDSAPREATETIHSAPAENSVLLLRELPQIALDALLHRYDLTLEIVAADVPIPGSYWGDPEAGVIGSTVYARSDTPIHSLLHEACHLIVLPAERRARVHTDASDSQAEEDATCYLQILLAECVPHVGSARLMTDMDAWGYTFRLGSTRAWFEHDADDARSWLLQRELLPLSVG